MKIAIIGTGVVARTLGQKLLAANHQITFGTRNIDATLANTSQDSFGNPPFSVWKTQHPTAQLTTFEQAAHFGELIINAVLGSAAIDALLLAGERNLEGKILIDLSNPLDFSEGFPPTLFVCNKESLGERIQNTFVKTKVVKTLNTMNCSVMVNPNLIPSDHNIFICGDDATAKASVKSLLSKDLGWEPDRHIDLGDITNARSTEMLLPLFARLYRKIGHADFNFHIAKKY